MRQENLWAVAPCSLTELLDEVLSDDLRSTGLRSFIRIVGDRHIQIAGAGPIDDCRPGDVTMIDDRRKLPKAIEAGAIAVVLPMECADEHEFDPAHIAETEQSKPTLLFADDIHRVFSAVVSHFRPRSPFAGLHGVMGSTPQIAASARVAASSTVGPGTVIGEGVIVGEGVVIGKEVIIGDHCRLLPGVVVMDRCRIGDGCTMFANVTLYEYTQVESDVIIHAGSVLGAHGFGYRRKGNRHIPAAQLGYVHVESDVEIGACVTIDRGSYGATRIGEGTKIDNQVMIGHNCRIGKRNLLCSQVGIAGSSSTGDDVVLAGQVGLKDHIHLGDGVIVGAQAGVMDNLTESNVYLGSPATTQKEQMQIMAVQRRLPEMRRELKQLRRRLDELQTETLSTQDDSRKRPEAA